MKKILVLLLALILYPQLSEAQSQRNPCYYPSSNPSSSSGCIPVSTTNPLPTAGSSTLSGSLPAGTNTIGSVNQVSQYPSGAIAITGNGAGTTGAVVGTLANAASKTTFICGFDVSIIGGTASSTITIAGIVGSSMNYNFTAAANATTLSRQFNPCIPASAVNTPITITTGAFAGATGNNVNSYGYQQ